MLSIYFKKQQKQNKDCNKKDKSKEKMYTKIFTKILIPTAKADKSIKMKRKTLFNSLQTLFFHKN